jgi:hypothetical protein
MARYSAPVDLQSARLLWKPLAADYEACLGFFHVLGAEISNGDCLSVFPALFGWVEAPLDVAQVTPRQLSCFLRSEATVFTDRKPA